MRIHPKMVLTEADLAKAVQHVSEYDEFVIDVETSMEGPKVNQVYWVGLAVPTGVYMIPMGHPLGVMTKPQTVEKRLPPDSERRVLKNGKLSEAKKEYRIPPEYADPPDQLRPDVVFAALAPLLFSTRRKIGHNVKFDLESVAKYYTPLGEPENIPPGPYGDTMLLTHVLDENLINYSLKTLVMDWLRVPQKERAEFYPNLGKVGVLTQPIDQVAWYLAKDLWYCLVYWKAHLRLLQERWPILQEALDLEHELLGTLMRMEMNGISIDTRMLQERGGQLSEEIKAIEVECWTLAGRKFDLSNNGQKRDIMFLPKEKGGQGLKPLTYTAKTQQPQINQAVLEHYAEKNRLAKLLLEWSEKEKLRSTFIEGMSKQLVHGKLHTSFNQHRTVTSRLSSSGPNLQQIPRGDYIRDAFWAEDGWMLVVSDYDQIELRCAAYLSLDPEMIRVFQDGMDIHAEAAASMLQKPPEDISKEERQVGKTMNFLTLYGGGTGKLARVANTDIPTAEGFITRYYERFAGLNAWKHREVYNAKERGVRGSRTKVPYCEIPPFHRRRRLPDLFSDGNYERAKAERQVVNSIVQGYAASIMKLALIDLHHGLADEEHLLLNVHDEVIVTAPQDLIDYTRNRVVRIMEGVQYQGKPALGPVPLTAEAKSAKRWSEGK